MAQKLNSNMQILVQSIVHSSNKLWEEPNQDRQEKQELEKKYLPIVIMLRYSCLSNNFKLSAFILFNFKVNNN